MSSLEPERPLWTPGAEQREHAEMARFMRWAGERSGRTFADYDELWRWSVDELEDFWASVWEFCGVRSSIPYERVLHRSRETRASGPNPRFGQHEMPGARWFEGSQLNYAENMITGLLPSPDTAPDAERDAPEAERGAEDRDRADRVAVLHTSELRTLKGTSRSGAHPDGHRQAGELEQITWGELSAQVAAAAAGLRALGVTRGDRVVAYMPNIPETLIAFLAVASIGAIWSSAAPEFGARSVIDRFSQIEPKVLLAVDGYRHGGKDFDRMAVLEGILAQLPSVEHTVLLPYLSQQARPGAAMPGGLTWSELLALDPPLADAPLRFEQVPFDHPLWVLYSSGTTGLPKAIVQSHGGILLEQVKKRMHLDLRAGDRMFWFTTTGWMMWNFLVGCLLSDAAIVLYDGSPAHPDLGALWSLAERAGITCMGLSAGLLGSCEKGGVSPARDYDLSALRAIGSTGSPLAPESFRWVYERVADDVWLFSTSGGTDVCTAFVAGCPLLPVYEGELQCRALGCAVEAWDEQGHSLTDAVGELVITEPMPSMPLYLWGDPSGERLRESYFAMYPGVWRHGDWIRITPRGGAVIYGRSDSTINRQGVRMGTSEIYRAAGRVEDVVDALVVDVGGVGSGSQLGDELTMILFVVLRDGVELDEQLTAQIKRRVREDCSPRHVPNEVRQIAEVPRTLSGKVLEVPVKRILMGADPREAASVDSLANPASLDYFVELSKTIANP